MIRFILLTIFAFGSIQTQVQLVPSLTLEDSQASDQDDMCIWIHPTPSLSTIIGSDKAANKLFVYDLQGNTIQAVSLPGKPGNIDVRYNFPLSGGSKDIVGYCDRTNNEIVFYTVDIATRQLSFAGSFPALGEVLGFCLYKSPNNEKFYGIVSAESGSGELRQWELADNNGAVNGIHKRTWINGSGGLTEGLVADDETGKLYAASENIGIYKYDADPTDSNPSSEMIAAVGENGLTADVEGIAIYYAADGEGFLIASSQGSSDFKVYQRKAPHDFVTTFTVQSASSTDGIDVTNVNLGGSFSKGVFLAHNGGSRILASAYEDIGILVDTEYWNPRDEPSSQPPDINEFTPQSGPVGIAVTITGQNLANTTSVIFNGVPADGFNVESDTQLSAIVPENATSGFIEVTTPAGTAVSTTVFEVLQTFLMALGNNWNLIGLPLLPPDGSVGILLPGAGPNSLFGYDGDYVPYDSLEAGLGYWLRLDAPDTVTIAGSEINSISLNLTAGWNLISGISQKTALADVIDSSEIIFPGSLFGFNGAYFSSDTLFPGEGYWIMANTTGQIEINSNNSKQVGQ